MLKNKKQKTTKKKNKKRILFCGMQKLKKIKNFMIIYKLLLKYRPVCLHIVLAAFVLQDRVKPTKPKIFNV